MPAPIRGGARKGAGRPKTKTPNVVTFSVCMLPKLKAQIDEVVKLHNEDNPDDKISRSDFIVKIITNYLKRRKKHEPTHRLG